MSLLNPDSTKLVLYFWSLKKKTFLVTETAIFCQQALKLLGSYARAFTV